MLKLKLKVIQVRLKLWKKKIQCLTHQALWSSFSPTLFTSDWANLPEHILDEIIKKMSDVDYSTFRAVCKSWRLMNIDHFCCLPRNIPLGVPILLNACKSDSNLHKFAKMSGGIACDNIFMPEAANKWVCGSSWGWLVLEGIDSREVSLLNPFTRRVIQLPSMNTFPLVPINRYDYIYKAILSTNPTISEQDCIIMAIVRPMRKLSYCKIGDKKWTNINYHLSVLCDVIYYKGEFYATTMDGDLMSCNIKDSNFTKKIASALPIDYYYSSRKYLVMASGRLLLVYRTPNNRFTIHLLKKCSPFARYHDQQYKWVEIDSIGDQLLFIENNGSFSLPARKHSSITNCIYFTENAFGLVQSEYHDYYHSFGMYDIAKKSTWFSSEKTRNHLRSLFWMIPSPW